MRDSCVRNRRYVHLSQSNPTLLRGMPVTDVLLHDGDQLEIGPGTSAAVTIVFQLGGAADNLDVTRSYKIRERPSRFASGDLRPAL